MNLSVEQIKEIKKVISDNLEYARCGIYDTRNIAGDEMVTIYSKNGITIDICYDYAYFEVFGLDLDDFINLRGYYRSLLLPKEWRGA